MNVMNERFINWPVGTSAGVNDQLFLGKELERAIALHIDGVAEVTVLGRKHGDDDAGFMIVGRFVDLLANRKLRHRELLLESSMPTVDRVADAWGCLMDRSKPGAARHCQKNQAPVSRGPILYGAVYIRP